MIPVSEDFTVAKEIWLPFPDYEQHYAISSLGRVKRTLQAVGTKSGLILKLQTHNDGYVLVDLCKFGVKKRILVSRAVCIAFNGPCPPGHECNHKNGVKSDNSALNLEWLTPSQNAKHKYEVLGHSLARFHAANPNKGKRGAANPLSKAYVVTSPTGHETLVKGLKHFCRNNGLSFGAMIQIATGSGHSHRHKGWKCRYPP